jgi:hypothetical protein
MCRHTSRGRRPPRHLSCTRGTCDTLGDPCRSSLICAVRNTRISVISRRAGSVPTLVYVFRAPHRACSIHFTSNDTHSPRLSETYTGPWSSYTDATSPRTLASTWDVASTYSPFGCCGGGRAFVSSLRFAPHADESVGMPHDFSGLAASFAQIATRARRVSVYTSVRIQVLARFTVRLAHVARFNPRRHHCRIVVCR